MSAAPPSDCFECGTVLSAEDTSGLCTKCLIRMEIVPDGTLKERVMRDGPMPITQAVETVLQIIGGLEAAHVKGVLHRDIKPANCFLAPDGTVKVGDFGLSISLSAKPEEREEET